MLVTTSHDCSPEIHDKAMGLCRYLGGTYVMRGGLSLIHMQEQYNDSEILVVGSRELRWINGAQPPMFFHPNLAMVRIKRLLNGEKDAMLEAAGVKNGDSVIDCTMGLASDAIVFSFAVGEAGQVVTLESETIPHLLACEGLRTYESGLTELREAMRRIRTVHTDHLDYLRIMPDRSADVVYFDPMFRRPLAGSAIKPLRSLANAEALRKEAIREAGRVARRTVVVKEHRGSGEFQRLGFQAAVESSAKFTYGVIRCDETT